MTGGMASAFSGEEVMGESVADTEVHEEESGAVDSVSSALFDGTTVLHEVRIVMMTSIRVSVKVIRFIISPPVIV